MRRVGLEENKISMYKRALPLTLAALLSLQGCVGGGVKEKGLNSGESEHISGVVHPKFMGTNLNLKTLDGKTVIPSVGVDHQGYYSIPVRDILDAYRKLGLTVPEYSLLESEGGNYKDQVPQLSHVIKGSIGNIIESNVPGSYDLNPLSTEVSGYIKLIYKKSLGVDTNIKQSIDLILRKLEINDMNNDGKMDTKDLKNSFSGTNSTCIIQRSIISGNNSSDVYISSAKERNNLVLVKSVTELEGGKVQVELVKGVYDWLEYSINTFDKIEKSSGNINLAISPGDMIHIFWHFNDGRNGLETITYRRLMALLKIKRSSVEDLLLDELLTNPCVF